MTDDPRIYVGHKKISLTIDTDTDLTDNSLVEIKVWVNGVSDTAITGTVSSPATAGIITATYASSTALSTAGTIKFQPIVTFADGSVMPCNTYELAVFSQGE